MSNETDNEIYKWMEGIYERHPNAIKVLIASLGVLTAGMALWVLSALSNVE